MGTVVGCAPFDDDSLSGSTAFGYFRIRSSEMDSALPVAFHASTSSKEWIQQQLNVGSPGKRLIDFLAQQIPL